MKTEELKNKCVYWRSVIDAINDQMAEALGVDRETDVRVVHMRIKLSTISTILEMIIKGYKWPKSP